MFGLASIQQTHIPNDIIHQYLKLYSLIGRNDTFLSTLNQDLNLFIEATVREDVFRFLGHLNITIPDARLRQMLLHERKPKNKNEAMLVRLKMIFRKMHQGVDDFELIVNEITALASMLYQDIVPDHELHFVKIAKKEREKRQEITLLSGNRTSKREDLEDLVNLYKQAIQKHKFEKGYAACHFYLDFMQLKPFHSHNDTLGLLVFYLLLLASDYRCFHLDSFFTRLFSHEQAFRKARQEALINYNEGISNAIPLHRLMLDLTISSYQEAQEMIRNYTYDHQHNKSDYIENTIKQLPDVFTKEDIRLKHPTVSDSTINRTLKRMKEEDSIRPLGTGRSAKWMKVPKKAKTNPTQMTLNFKEKNS